MSSRDLSGSKAKGGSHLGLESVDFGTVSFSVYDCCGKGSSLQT